MKRETVFQLTLDDVEQAIVNYVVDKNKSLDGKMLTIQIHSDYTATVTRDHSGKE